MRHLRPINVASGGGVAFNPGWARSYYYQKGRLYEELRAIDRDVDREMAPYRRGMRKKRPV